MNVFLAQPRGFCAGVVRAIEIVETALDVFGPPVYVLHEIVHNRRVVDDLRDRGAMVVENVEEVPRGSRVIFSAHGVSNARVAAAKARDLEIIDATCPLVTKVHLEAARHAKVAREVIFLGHAGHPEVVGTFGRYDVQWGGKIYLVQTVEDVAGLEVRNPDDLAYITQTTLSVDDTNRIVEALRGRFPKIKGPRKDDICYATQNRQNAVRRLAEKVDVLIVVGARNSSNSNRLRDVGEHMGLRSYLVEDADELDPSWVKSSRKVGITAGASAPEILVREVLSRLREYGVDGVEELDAEPEGVTFALPSALLQKAAVKV